MSKRLWDKGGLVNDRIHAFTVGSDPIVDKRIIRWDIVASAAHARMLFKIGLLSEADLASLLGALREAHLLALAGMFEIPPDLEDCHTALETFLVDKVGESGRRIHAGRSRNDQVLVALRLFIKHNIISLMGVLCEGAAALLARARLVGDVPMPGYTHMQPAMPSSVAMWMQSFAEWHLELIEDGHLLLQSIDSNPLGAGSGFGVSLPLDRQLTTSLLGFSRVQRNPMHVQNSRGRMELKMLRWFEDVGCMVEKFAWDLILFSSREFGFFTLPVEFTTGSSIMPQKRNPDVLELMRGGVSRIRGAARELEYVIAKLPSSYHRDFQLTKEPTIRACDMVFELAPLVAELTRGISINESALRESMTDELYATYDVFRSVQKGEAFRDAYKATGASLANGTFVRGNLEVDFDNVRALVAAELTCCSQELDGLREKSRVHLEVLELMENQVLQKA